jgi:hypothetical protein
MKVFIFIWSIKILIIIIGVFLIYIGYKLTIREVKSDNYEIKTTIPKVLTTTLKSKSPGMLFVLLGVLLIALPLVISVPFEVTETQKMEERYDIPKEKRIEFPKRGELFQKKKSDETTTQKER